MTLGNLKLGGLSTDQRERLAGYVKLLLLWVAASDGDIDESELEFAGNQFPDAEGTIQTKDLLAIIRKADFVEIEKAVRTLSTESRELRIAFLDLAISMSIADKEIAITENHILRFYADALFLGTEMLKKRFQAICGSPYFEPGDPGSPEWWEQDGENKLERDRHAQFGDKPASDTVQPDPQAAPEMTPEQAHAMLGLVPGATSAELEDAYKELSSIFQIHRVESMGDAAVSIARMRLKKIDHAYGLLRNDAQ